MNFSNQLKNASRNFRYQKLLLEHTIFPQEDSRYPFNLHAITRARFHYPNGISLTELPCYVLLYTITGTVSLLYDNQTFALNAGTTVWFDCSKGFHINITATNRDWDFILLFASGASMPTYHTDFINDNDITISSVHSNNIPSLFEQIYSNTASGSKDSPIICSKLLCDLVTSLVLDRSIHTQYGEKPEYIIRIIHYIETHYQERLTLDSIASHFTLSKYSLSRAFTTYMDQSLIDYLIDFRIKESRKLLQFTDLPISEIATATGFITINNYIHQFKKRTHLTPSNYRSQNQIYSSSQRLSNNYAQIESTTRQF